MRPADKSALLQHRRFRLLLAYCSFNCRVGIIHPIFQRRYVATALQILSQLPRTCSPSRVEHLADKTAVYQWASVTAGRYGRVCGWFAGWWNFFAWIFGAASISAILGNQTVSMYSIMHPGFEAQPWHIFVSYLLCTWICCGTVLFANRALPMVGNLGSFFIVAGVIITIIVCAVMPHVQDVPYASNDFVWHDWINATGYTSDGFVFVAGMLNGAFAVGSTDCVTHLAEEIPQ
jgi:amino acid transporter